MGLQTVDIGSAPVVRYIPENVTSTRIDNNTMQYKFSFKVTFVYDLSFLGTGFELFGQCQVKNSNNTTIATSSRTQFKWQDEGAGPSVYWPQYSSGDRLSTLSFTINVPSPAPNEKYKFYLTIDGGDSRGDNTSVGTAYVGDLTSTALLYSKVTNPTTTMITGLTNQFVAPGVDITLSWDGAKAGTNNPIKEFQIGRSDINNSSNINYTISVAANKNSVNLHFSEIERGSTYYFFIKTIGTVDGYDDNWINIGSVCRVNRKPKDLSITPSKTKVSTAGENITFNFSATDADGQSISYYYRLSSDSEFQIATNPLTKFITEDTTLEAYAYDGLESSASTTVEIKVNKSPIIEKVELTQNSNYSTTISVSATDSDGDSLQYIYSLKDSLNNTIYSYTSNNSRYTVSDLRDFFSSLWNENNYYWAVRVYDQYDYSGEVNSGTFTMPAPKIINIYNDHADGNLQNSNKNHFSDKMRISIDLSTSNNSEYTQCRINIDNRVISASISKTTDADEYWHSDFSGLKNYTTPGMNYNIGITLVGSNGKSWTIPTSINTNRTRAPLFSILNLTSGLSTFQPFSLDPNYEYNVLSIANNNCTNEDQLKNNYSLTLSGFSYKWNINTIKEDKEYSITADFDGNSIIIKQTGENLFKALPSNKSINYSADYPSTNASIELIITNVFGDKVTQSIGQSVNFRQAAQITNAPILYIGNESEKVAYNSNLFLQEGVCLYTKGFTIKDYHGISKAQIEINRNNEGWVLLSDIELSFSGSPYQFNSPIEYSAKDTLFHQIGEILRTENYNCKLRLVFTNNAGIITIKEFNNEYLVLPHYASTVNLLSSEYTKASGETTGKVSFKASIGYGWNEISNPSTNFELTREASWIPVIVETNPYSGGVLELTGIEGLSTELNKDFIYTIDKRNWISWQLKIKTKQTLNFGTGLVDSVKEQVSNIVIVYDISPTVAYRLNHLGINTKNFSDTDVLVVSAASNRDIVKFTSSAGDITLDLSTGRLEGVSIDFGAWE